MVDNPDIIYPIAKRDCVLHCDSCMPKMHLHPKRFIDSPAANPTGAVVGKLKAHCRHTTVLRQLFLTPVHICTSCTDYPVKSHAKQPWTDLEICSSFLEWTFLLFSYASNLL